MVERLEQLLKEQKIPRPFGIFLSGGIDSGLLAVLLKPDFAISISYPTEGERYDESKNTKIIADIAGIPLRIIESSKEEFEANLKKAINVMGKPVNFVGLTSLYLLMEQVKDQTIITGDGGDELFGGYSRYLILNHIYKLYEFPELKNYYPMLDSCFGDLHSKLIKKELPLVRDMKTALDLEMKHNLPDLLEMGNRLAEHFNVNLYQPFLAESVKDFARNLPMKYKIRGNTTKWILRELIGKYLPTEIANNKDKRGLPCPVNKWMGWPEFSKDKYLEYQWTHIKNHS